MSGSLYAFTLNLRSILNNREGSKIKLASIATSRVIETSIPIAFVPPKPDAANIEKPKNKTIEENDKECLNILNQSLTLLPTYTINNIKKYFIVTTQKAQLGIQRYITLLQNNGFIVDFFPWEPAKINGIQFVNTLPVSSYVDNACMCNS